MPVLGELTSPEASGTAVLLVPLGSVEQHGPHLPLSTDSMIASAVCQLVADTQTGEGVSAAVAPCLEFGSSGEHEGFAGTISISRDALRHVLVELVRSARQWADRIVLVSGHGGNVDAMVEAVRLLRFEQPTVAWTTCAEPDFDAHAGHAETSMMLAIAPSAVCLDRAVPGNTGPVAELWPALRAGGVAAVSPNGVLGDPAGASAEEGRRMLARLSGRIARQIRDAHIADDGALVRPSAVAS